MVKNFILGRTRGGWQAAFSTSLLITAAAGFGCGETSEEAPHADEANALPQQAGANGGAASSADWCAVKKIMDKSCTVCHDGEFTAGSPMGLTKHEDFLVDAPLSPGKKVYEAVAARMNDRARPMPPRGLLPADQLKIVNDWVAAGAPAGSDPTCSQPTTPSTDGSTTTPTTPTTPTPDAGAQDDSGWAPGECDEVYEIRAHAPNSPTAPYVVPAGQEIHPQVRVDPPWGSEKVQAVRFKPLTDNGKVLHHWILFSGMSMLTGWAPGDDEDLPYPPDVGMDMPNTPGSLRLDMHYYNTAGTKAEPDRSGVAVCVVKGARLRKHSAAVHMGFTAFGPVLAPARTRGHEATATCTVTGTQPVHLLTASPHAHKYARHMRFTVTRANGEKIVMHDAPFKFGEQGTYPLDPPVTLQAGDKVTTTCVFDNDTNRNITFGESTENEMCFNFAVYYPKGALRCGGLGGGLFGR